MPSPLTLIRNATAILPDKLLPKARLTLRDGLIFEVTRDRPRVPRDATVIDARGGYVSPGFIDIHVHGGGGADFMDGTPDAVRTVLTRYPYTDPKTVGGYLDRDLGVNPGGPPRP